MTLNEHCKLVRQIITVGTPCGQQGQEYRQRWTGRSDEQPGDYLEYDFITKKDRLLSEYVRTPVLSTPDLTELL